MGAARVGPRHAWDAHAHYSCTTDGPAALSLDYGSVDFVQCWSGSRMRHLICCSSTLTTAAWLIFGNRNQEGSHRFCLATFERMAGSLSGSC